MERKLTRKERKALKRERAHTQPRCPFCGSYNLGEDRIGWLRCLRCGEHFPPRDAGATLP